MNIKDKLFEDFSLRKFKDFQVATEYASTLDRDLFLTDEIIPDTGNSVDSYIRYWNIIDEDGENAKPIKLFIDSPGGDLNATFTIIDSIKLSKIPVWTINIGKAYSGGMLVFLAGKKRIAYPHASFLLHEGGTGMGGTSSQFENFSQFYKKQLKQIKEFVLKNTNFTEEEYENIKKEDTWFLATEAKEKGMVDEIYEI